MFKKGERQVYWPTFKTVFRYILICHVLFLLIPSQVDAAIVRERHEYEKTGHVFWEIPTDEKIVALTFDDGPDRTNTPLILDVLKKYGAKATFFVVGKNVKENADVVQRTIIEGHELGNHTYTHTYNESINQATLTTEMNKTDMLLLELFAIKPTFFRPVGGYYNDLIIETAIEAKHDVFLWSWHQDTRDWANRNKKQLSAQVLNNIRPGDVILFHDGGGDRTPTIEAIKEIIPALQDEGYSFLTLSEMVDRHKFSSKQNTKPGFRLAPLPFMK